MSDLVKEARGPFAERRPASEIMLLMADEIERLEGALQRIVDYEVPMGVGSEVADWLKDIARDATRNAPKELDRSRQ